MELLTSGIRDAVALLAGRDAQVLDAAWRSLWISSLAVAIALLLGVPLGVGLARARFYGQALVVLGCRAAMATPTVFLGLVCFGLFSRRGPLGPWELLYSPIAIVIGEVLLAAPIIVSMTHGAVRALDGRVAETLRTLGTPLGMRVRTYVSEARIGITLAVLTAFSRCVTELGIAMMVGGNLKERTRTLATATALETSKGEFARGLAMGGILLLLATGVTLLIVALGREGRAHGGGEHE